MRRFLGSLTIAAAVIAIFTPASQAANGSNFDPGYIISDATFYDAAAMSTSQIQSFLNSKGSNCVAGEEPCLKDYTMTTRSISANSQCSSYTGKSNETSAAIIYKVAQACDINPQVLLVLLEKEQSLVGRTRPTSRAYQIATGYGCPDTAPCDTEYYGFQNQVYLAAKQYQRYRDYPGNYAHQAGRTQQVLYHPTASCGSSAVYIRNQATAGLYNYTPYQPNNAALNNLYGSGDSCSSYGNRNFWRIFTDWFGSTANIPPVSLVQRDWNTDGYSDMLARHSNGRLYAYFGRADGSGLTGKQIGHGWNGMRLMSTAYNFNGTAMPQIVSIHSNGLLYLYTADGKGGFKASGTIGQGWGAYDQLVGVSQWGGQRLSGIVTRHRSTGNYYYYPKTVGGGWLPRVSLDLPDYDLLFFAGDWNKDGFADMLGRNSADGHLYMISAEPDGSTQDPVRVGTNWGAFTNIFSGGDWNNDGNVDVLATNAKGDLHLYTGNGRGGFGTSMKFGHGWGNMEFLP